MKKLAGVAVMTLAAALQPAAAADTDVLYGRPPVVYAPQPAVVIFTWTGFYFGVHGGGGWGHTDVNGSPYSIASTVQLSLPRRRWALTSADGLLAARSEPTIRPARGWSAPRRT